MRMDSREAFIVLNMIEGVGPVRARSLLEHFGDASKILAASKSALLRVRNIGDDTAEKIASWEKSVDLAGELKRISDFGCHVLISADEDYPAMLREIYDPPLVNDVPICKKKIALKNSLYSRSVSLAAMETKELNGVCHTVGDDIASGYECREFCRI